MIDSLLKDTLQVLNDGKILISASRLESTHDFWMWISLAEFLVIITLIYFRKNKINQSLKQNYKEDSLKEVIDFGNVINSSFNSQQLYDELKKKCHPDRFPNDNDKNSIAIKLFQEISENKNNSKRLSEIKEVAEKKLQIKF
jgi:hypothetical protein